MCGQGFGLALLVALSVLAVSHAVSFAEFRNPSTCDLKTLRSLDVPVSRIAGKWYRRLGHVDLPSDKTLLGYVAEIIDTSDQEGEKMRIDVAKEFPEFCEGHSHSVQCTVQNGQTNCEIEGFPCKYKSEIWALSSDNNIIVFGSGVTMENGTSYKFFDVYTRDPLSKLTSNDLEQFRSELVPACSEDVLDPHSNFYSHVFNYEHSRCPIRI